MSEATPEVNNYTIDGDVFKVLINDEVQYSLWPAGQQAPAGWTEVGFTGDMQECSDYVDQHWVDMRPLSLQKAMAS
jgi:MbtH protein